MDQRIEDNGSTERYPKRNQSPRGVCRTGRLTSRDQNVDGPGECPYFLDLTEVDKIMENLDEQLAKMTNSSNSKSLHMFSKSFNQLVGKVRSLQATTLHQNSTRMKRHLLSQIVQQRRQRGNIQAKYEQLLQQLQSQSQFDYGRSISNDKWCKTCPVKEQQIQQLLKNTNNLQKIVDGQRQGNIQMGLKIASQLSKLTQLQSLNHKMSELTSKNQELARENEQSKCGYKKLNSMLAIVNQKLATTEDNLNKVTSQLGDRGALETRNSQLALQNKQSLANLDIMGRRVSGLQQQNHNLEQRSKNLTNRLQQKQKTMNTWIQSMQKRNQSNLSRNLPLVSVKPPFLQQVHNTPLKACEPKNNMVNKVSTLKVPPEYRQPLNGQSHLSKDAGRSDQSLCPNGDQILRMLLLQACSLEEYFITDQNHAIQYA